MKNTEKKCKLTIDWHFSLSAMGEDAALVIEEDFPNLAAAVDRMDSIMPDDYDVDDGTDIEDWDEVAEPWTTFVAYTDKKHYMMARLETWDF